MTRVSLWLCVIGLTLVVEGKSPWDRIRIDCGFSPWSEWMECGGFGQVERYREITRQARGGGKPCPTYAKLVDTNPCVDGAAGEEPSLNSTIDGFVKNFIEGQDRNLNDVITGGPARKGQSRVKRGDTGGPTVLPRDVLFLVDVSTSIRASVWENVKWGLVDIIRTMCNGIGSGDNNNRFALWLYSSHPIPIFDFDDYFDFAEIRQRIISTRFKGDATCSTEAINTLRLWLLNDTSVNGARPRDPARVRREVLILTDGHSNCELDTPEGIQAAAGQLQADDVRVFSLAIGALGSTGQNEIQSLVTKPTVDHLFSLKSFNDYDDLISKLEGTTLTCSN